MNEKQLLRKIREQAKRDALNRLDRRFKETMGFLVAKGLLKVNYPVRRMPNQRLRIEDAIWAGQNGEPRILEVLPTAVLRLEKHFDLDEARHPILFRVVEAMREGATEGEAFLGVPFAKLRAWRDFPLLDGRTKLQKDKKITKTFRLRPDVLEFLVRGAQAKGCTETAFLEACLLATGS
jgi:hypothetical protein